MFASKDIFLKSSGGYQISRSVRLRSSASAYFNRTPSVASNQQKWTWSAWVKRGALGTLQNMFGANVSGTNSILVYWSTGDNLQFGSNGGQINLQSTAVYRDIAAWYHVVAVFDSAQATASDRQKLYVNGVQLTSFSIATYPAQNTNCEVNSVNPHNIGRNPSGLYYYDGYMAEVNFIDGQALTPSSFGETNAVTGVWQPKAYAGTYGTNGFYLNFSDNSGVTATTIGKDYSGNGNNWTPNNISVTAGVTYDSMIDVPTPYADGGNGRGNYAVLNPLSVPAYTYAGGNLNVSGTTANTYAPATIVLPKTGKYYFEYVCTNTAGANRRDTMGVVDLTQTKSYLSNIPNTVVYFSLTGAVYTNGSTLTTYASYTNGDVVQCAIDCATGKVWFGLNGSFNGSPSAGTGQVQTLTNNGSLAFAVGNQDNSGSYSLNGSTNFGQRPFAYTPPTGFVALNTLNLPDPNITNGAQYMAATTYTGTGASLTVANTVGSASFQPDLVWVKGRSGATDHAWYDAVRGVQKQLESNTTTAETTETTGLTAFGSTGFTVGALAQMNTSAATYVAWQWNAGGSTVTNTSGTISSQVRANTTAGFSVVTWTAGGAGTTIGHGLGVAPNMIIVKDRSVVADWCVYTTTTGAGAFLKLNATAASAADTTMWGNTTPTSTTFKWGYSTGDSMVAYCFAAVAGYSAFGKYTGNGSADGPFVFLGFRPRWVMIKRTDSTGNWQIIDTSRSTYNEAVATLYPNLTNAEDLTNTKLDALSNGFKIRGTPATDFNVNGSTYVYACFAENPFKLSLAR